jgi:hypothetical protein
MTNLLTLLNAADKAGVTESNMNTLDTSLAFQRQPSLVSGAPTVATGAPTIGTFPQYEVWVDALSALFLCTVAGTPGTWVQVEPGVASAFPATAPAAGYKLNRSDLGKVYVYNGTTWLAQGSIIAGTFAIPAGADHVAVTGLALPFTPTVVLPSIAQPAGGLQIACNPVATGITTDGFTITFNGITDSANYILFFIVA